MGNELDHTIVEPQPCPNECDRLARHILSSNGGGIVTIHCLECGRIHAGHYTNIADLIKAWNGSKEGE